MVIRHVHSIILLERFKFKFYIDSASDPCIGSSHLICVLYLDIVLMNLQRFCKNLNSKKNIRLCVQVELV